MATALACRPRVSRKAKNNIVASTPKVSPAQPRLSARTSEIKYKMEEEHPSRASNIQYKPRFVNKAKIRRLALDVAAELRAHKFTRVGAQFYAGLDAHIEKIIRTWVQANPSRGRTLVAPFSV